MAVRTIEQVTGANRVGTAPARGDRIVDIAYNAGTGDQPVRCATAAYVTHGFPTFNCHGYVGGSSGSPWLTPGPGRHRQVVGLIGGLHQGGCYEYTSYSPSFAADVARLVARASAGTHPDTAPEPGGDGC